MRLLLLLSACVALVLNGSGAEPTPGPVPASAPAPTSSPRGYLALGDSYTIGEGVPASARWGGQLAELGQTSGIQAPDIIAQTGWTTAELQAAIAASGNQKTYDLVSLMIGVNNQFRGLPLAAYRREFRELLGTATRFAGNRPARVLVLSIPDWGRSPLGRGYDRGRVSREIDQFNDAARQECQQAGVAFVDITDLTRAAQNDPTQFAPDSLHYSAAHMRQWARRVLPVAQALLR